MDEPHPSPKSELRRSRLNSDPRPMVRRPVSYGHRVAKTKKLFATLTRRGPHRVLRGDLAFAGLSGVVYTPESGLSLPGVAFGHD